MGSMTRLISWVVRPVDSSRVRWSERRRRSAAKRAEAAEARALRHEVAAAKGLTPAQAKRLAGTTKEELEADADEILADFAPAKKPSDKLPARPQPKKGAPVDDPRELTGKERAAAAFRQFSTR